MNNLDNIIKSINGQVLKIQEELKNSITNANSKEELESITKYIEDNISINPNISHILVELNPLIETKRKEISNKPISSVSVYDKNSRPSMSSPYIEITDYPSFLPYRYWFFMRNALWQLAGIDASCYNKDTALESFNDYLEGILHFCVDDNDKKELDEFFKKVSNIGGFAASHYSTISKQINDFKPNQKKATELRNLGNNPYKDVTLNFDFIRDSEDNEFFTSEIMSFISDVETSKEYVVYWQNKNDERIVKPLNYQVLKDLFKMLLDLAKTEKDLIILENEFKKFDKSFGKTFFNDIVKPSIDEKTKNIVSPNKFKKAVQPKEKKYYFEEIKKELDKIERNYDEFLEKTRKYVETSDLDELDVFILRLQNLSKELDSLYSSIDDKIAFESVSQRISKDIKIVRKKKEMINELIDSINKIDFDL